MKIFFVLTAFLISALTTLAQTKAASGNRLDVPKIQCAVVRQINTELRTQPNIKSRVVLLLNSLQPLEILQKTNTWYFAKLPDSQFIGYIRQQDILMQPCRAAKKKPVQTKAENKTIVKIGLQIMDLNRQNDCKFQWNKQNDVSNVACYFSPDNRPYKILIEFRFKGDLTAEPESYSFVVNNKASESPAFERSTALEVITDRQKVTVQNWSYDLKSSENKVTEILFFDVSAALLKQMGNSTDAEINVGSVSFHLNKEQQKLLQDIVKLSSLN